MKAYKNERRVKRTKNTVGSNVRVWVQTPIGVVAVALGHPDMENKTNIPESWEIGHLPVYFSFCGASIALTDLTEQELDQVVMAFNLAINAARPICKILDQKAYEALESGVELDEVPKRILRGPAPQLVREINTVLPHDPYDDDPEDREILAG
jgi:hypothetical protein